MNIVQKHKQHLFLMGVLGLVYPLLIVEIFGLNEKYTKGVSSIANAAL